jgi:biopolymer transport protein ExbB
MARYREWLPPTGRGRHAAFAGLLVLVLVPACSSHQKAPDAATTVGDSNVFEDDALANVAPNLDARPGLGGGSPCDASEQCLSGACSMGLCSDWAHVMRIAIDTTPTGADVRETITEFPLLVRLNDRNFAFAEARTDGADIRFLDSGGHNLSYEIERWDAPNAIAEIWVLVPSITGNSRDNTVLMYWGNPLSATTNSGPSVFKGYSCVFHMGEDPNSAASQFEDDSAENKSGTLLGPTRRDSRVEGVIGTGLALDGLSMLTTSQQLPAPQTMAISLWLKTTSSTGGGIAGFANKSNSLQHDRSVTMDSSGRLSFSILRNSELATVTSLAGYSDDNWHFIVARFSTAGQYLFVDGESVADDPTLTGAYNYSGSWRFGAVTNPAPPADPADAAVATDSYFTGTIDEARISTDEPSDDWIKLSYATQRTDTSAVIYPARP